MPLRSIIISLLAAGLVIVTAGGCARVSRPEQDLQERLSYNEAVRQRYQLDSEWWKVYNDEQLNRLVSRALASNIDLAKAAVSVNKALYQAELLATGLVPEFSGNIDGSLKKDITHGGATTRNYSGGLGISYELDLWRRVADSVSALEWEAKATMEDRESARLALIGSVVDAYYNLAYLNDAVSATRASLKNYRDIDQTVEIKYETGKVSAVEPAQARQAILSAENSLTDYQAQKKKAEQVLRDLLNLKPDQPLDLKEPTLGDLKLPGLDLNIPLSVLANRPDLRAAEFRLEKSLKNVDEAEKGWLPSITLNAALNSNGRELKNAFNLPVAVGAFSINLPFLQWDKVRLNLRISEEDFESARLDFEKTLTTALNEVDTYYYSYTKSRQSLTNLRRRYAYDVKISQYHRDRYEAGAGELSDWLGALNTVNTSRLSSLNGLYQAIQYETLVHKALAGHCTDLARAVN